MQNKKKTPLFLSTLIAVCFAWPLTIATPHFITNPAPVITPKIQQQAQAKTYRLTPAPLPQNPNPILIQKLATPKTTPQPQPQKPTTMAIPQNKSLLGTQEYAFNNLNNMPKWTRVLNRIKAEKTAVTNCDNNNCATPQLKKWRQFIRDNQNKPLLTQLKNLNAYANNFPYITDSKLWGKSDYWASPLEFLKHSGDCEDYVILKYTTLRHLGVPAQNLRLVVVKDTVRNLAHAVLAVYNGNDIYILDSLFNAVLSHKQVLQYIPYYSVNENNRWAHVKALK